VALGSSLLAFVGYALGFWMPAFFMRTHGLEASRAGLILGASGELAGWIGSAAGTHLLMVTFIGLAPGPYMVGCLSGSVGDLRFALRCCLVAHGLAVVAFLRAARHLATDEATIPMRAEAAGEPHSPGPTR
jgi:cyanate permease